MKCLGGIESESHTRRSCKLCKSIYMKSYRATGQFLESERLRYQKLKNSNLMKAKGKVYNEVRYGRLPKASDLKCIKCGEQAHCYDHRDYLKPLDVNPVCARCNKLMGEGLNK